MPDEKPWLIRDVPERIRREIKLYGVAHTLTVAQALEFLIDCAIESKEVRRIRWHDALIYFKHAGLPKPSDSEAAALLSRSAEIRQRHEKELPVDLTGLDLASLRFASLIDSIPRGALGPEEPEPFAHSADSNAASMDTELDEQ